jgi:single-strand DNA-binding protein
MSSSFSQKIDTKIDTKKNARIAKKNRNNVAKNVGEDFDQSLNELTLRGRVSAPATVKELPSGDKVVEFRLIVSRSDRNGVDTLDIAAWSANSRKRALSLQAEQWIEINGAIHRRFWQSPSGLASRWQVEAIEIVRI